MLNFTKLDITPLQTRVMQFDNAIRRIVNALGIREACGGVDEEDKYGSGGHTAMIIEKHIRARKRRIVEEGGGD